MLEITLSLTAPTMEDIAMALEHAKKQIELGYSSGDLDNEDNEGGYEITGFK